MYEDDLKLPLNKEVSAVINPDFGANGFQPPMTPADYKQMAATLSPGSLTAQISMTPLF